MSQLMVKSSTGKQCVSRVVSLVRENAVRKSSAAHSNPNPHGWKSWRDIPDSMIPTVSKRDPSNKIYATRKYINLRKQMIWMQIPDGTPVYLKNGLPDQIFYYGSMVGVTGCTIATVYYLADYMFGGKKKDK